MRKLKSKYKSLRFDDKSTFFDNWWDYCVDLRIKNIPPVLNRIVRKFVFETVATDSDNIRIRYLLKEQMVDAIFKMGKV